MVRGALRSSNVSAVGGCDAAANGRAGVMNGERRALDTRLALEHLASAARAKYREATLAGRIQSHQVTTALPPPWVLVSAAWLGPAILASFEAYMQSRLGNRPPVTWRTIAWEGGDWLIYAAFTPIVFQLARRLPLRRATLRRNLGLHFAASLALCLLWASLGTVLRWLLLPDAGDALTMHFLASWSLTTLPFGVAMYFAVLGIAHAVSYFVEARERETQAARLSEQLAEARLGALRMQLNPHFLFNSLNAITVLVRDHDTHTSARMLEQLADVFRRVLRTDRAPEVPLGEEIDFVERYVALEQIRFADRLRPTFDVDRAVLSALVPDFILQPLVENALRHGLGRRTEAGLLVISAHREGDDLVLSVRDDGPGLDERRGSPTTGVGLANTRERLNTLYGDRGRLDLTSTMGGGVTATIRIPYHETRAHGEVAGAT